jgi:hypothetical protein
MGFFNQRIAIAPKLNFLKIRFKDTYTEYSDRFTSSAIDQPPTSRLNPFDRDFLNLFPISSRFFPFQYHA